MRKRLGSELLVRRRVGTGEPRAGSRRTICGLQRYRSDEPRAPDRRQAHGRRLRRAGYQRQRGGKMRTSIALLSATDRRS